MAEKVKKGRSKIGKRAAALLLVFCVLVSLLAISASAATVSYNGVDLPDIKSISFDEEVYPYQYIYYSDSGYYYFYISSYPFYKRNASYLGVNATSASEKVYMYRLSDGSWSYYDKYSVNVNTSYFDGTPIWSSHDIYYSDGTLYIASAYNRVDSITFGGFPDSCPTGRYIVGWATVSGTGDFDPTYTITLSGGTSSGTKLAVLDNGDYHLNVALDETAETLTLTATSNADPSITATHVVTVKQVPTIADIVVSPASVDALPGDTVQFTASVSGYFDYDTGVTWTLQGDDAAFSGGVTVEDGLVTIPDTYTGVITVRAYASGDNAYFDEATITVQSSSGDSGGDTGSGDSSGGSGDTGSGSGDTGGGDNTGSGDSGGGDSGEGSDTGGETTDPEVSSTPSIIDQEKAEADSSGNSAVDDLTEAVPDYSEQFIEALREFASAFSYEGTEAVLPIPSIKIPCIPGLIPETVIFDGEDLDFGDYIVLLPSGLLLLVQSLLTIALIVYCFKELYDAISYVLTLRRGSGGNE